MKHTQLRITPQGLTALHNAEAALPGQASKLVNLREREDCLAAVGMPAAAGSIAASHRLLAIDGTHLVTARDRQVAIDGQVVATAAGRVREARVMGRFVVITTTAGSLVLHRRGDSYVPLIPAEAVPGVRLAASATARFTATVPAITFDTPYRSWQAPLSTQDERATLAAVTGAWRDAMAAATAAGRHCGVLLARYAVRLWDDSYLWMSQPVALGGATVRNHYRAGMALTTADSQFTGTRQGTLDLDAFAIEATALDAITPTWLPLVKAVDVLATPAISPVATTLDYRCATDASSHMPVLEAGLRPRPYNALWDDLLAAGWAVVATAVPAADGTLVFTPMRTPSGRFTNARLAPLMAHLAWERHDCAALVHDGRLHLAPRRRRPVNPWRVALWCEQMTGQPCEAVVTVTLTDEQGTRYVTTRENISGEPTALNALVAYPDVRATHIIVNIGSRSWQAHLTPWHEAGLAIAVAPSWQGHATVAGTLAVPSGADDSLAERASLAVSEVLNPFVFTTKSVGLHHDILAMATAVTPIYNGGFGRYPIYLFTTGGILALAQGTTAYGGTRPVAEQIIADEMTPVTGADRVWFVDRHRRLCALHGARVEVLSGPLDASSIAWNSVERELVAVDTAGRVTVRMSSGRFYHRDVAWRQVFSDEARALAVDPDGNVFDLQDEDPAAMVTVAYRSRPILADELMRNAPHYVVWNAHAHDARLTLGLLATRLPPPVAAQPDFDDITCPRDGAFPVAAITARGHLLRPLAMRVPPLPQRAFILKVEGSGGGISLHPVLIGKRM